MRALMFAMLLPGLSLAAAPDEGPKLGAPSLTYVNLPREQGDLLLGRLADAFGKVGVRVVTPTQLVALLGVERQRQLLGCEQSTSCLTELSGALGVDGVLSGTLGKFGEQYQASFAAVSNKGELMASFSGTANGTAELDSLFERAAREMAPGVGDALHKPVERWGRSVISIGALGWTLRQYRIEYERLLDDHWAIYVTPEVDLRQASLAGFPTTNGALSDSLLLTFGLRRYNKRVQEGLAWGGALQIQSAFSFSSQIAQGILAAYLIGTVQYRWAFGSHWIVGVGAGLGLGVVETLTAQGLSYGLHPVLEPDLSLGYRF